MGAPGEVHGRPPLFLCTHTRRSDPSSFTLSTNREQIKAVILTLKSRTGSSLPAIKKALGATQDQWRFINAALKKGVEAGFFVKNGGKYKLSAEAKKAPKKKKPKKKKAAKKKKPKKKAKKKAKKKVKKKAKKSKKKKSSKKKSSKKKSSKKKSSKKKSKKSKK